MVAMRNALVLECLSFVARGNCVTREERMKGLATATYLCTTYFKNSDYASLRQPPKTE